MGGFDGALPFAGTVEVELHRGGDAHAVNAGGGKRERPRVGRNGDAQEALSGRDAPRHEQLLPFRDILSADPHEGCCAWRAEAVGAGEVVGDGVSARGPLALFSAVASVLGAFSCGGAHRSGSDAIQLRFLEGEPDRSRGGGDRAPDVGQILIDAGQDGQRGGVEDLLEGEAEPGDIEAAAHDPRKVRLRMGELRFSGWGSSGIRIRSSREATSR